ncbi:MAG: hypothetical protein HUN04_17230 [Desulfobacter sp.]|nr:MAG: hypothetical protein HUN04_17230 [Desulfobacter sp.]
MKKIMIMGLGDVLQGDLGAGCAVLEKMAETASGEDIEYAYLALDSKYATGYILGADLAIITGALDLSGVPGTLHVWNQKIFDQHVQWMAKSFPIIGGLAWALSRARMWEQFPGRMVYLWIDPHATEGYGLSDLMNKAVIRAVWQIHREIWKVRLDGAGKPAPRSLTA